MGDKANSARLDRATTRLTYLYACGLLLRSIRQTVPKTFRFAYWLYFIVKSDRLWRAIEATHNVQHAKAEEDSKDPKDG